MGHCGEERRGGSAFTGALLVILGVLLLMNQMGLTDIGTLWRYWPGVFIALGISKLLSGGGPDRIGNGVMDLCLGVAFFAITFEWWELSWWNGWPLILIAVGVGTVARSLWRGDGRPNAPADSHASVVDEEGRHA